MRPAGASRGLGPARLDGQAPLATVAEKAMNWGKTASGLQTRSLRRINAARRAPLHAAGMPGWCLPDQAQPGRRYFRGAKQRAAGMVRRTIPWSASEARRPERPKASGIEAGNGCAAQRGAGRRPRARRRNAGMLSSKRGSPKTHPCAMTAATFDLFKCALSARQRSSMRG